MTTTTPLAGDRSRRARNPRDITGRRYAEQQAEQAAKLKSEEVDWYKVGFDTGFDAGVQSVLRELVAEGVIDADEPGESE